MPDLREAGLGRGGHPGSSRRAFFQALGGAELLFGSTTFTSDGPVFEAGVTTPSIAVTGSVGVGLSTADAIGGALDFFSPSAASGGFVIYPSRPNLNAVESVYKK